MEEKTDEELRDIILEHLKNIYPAEAHNDIQVVDVKVSRWTTNEYYRG